MKLHQIHKLPPKPKRGGVSLRSWRCYGLEKLIRSMRGAELLLISFSRPLRRRERSDSPPRLGLFWNPRNSGKSLKCTVGRYERRSSEKRFSYRISLDPKGKRFSCLWGLHPKGFRILDSKGFRTIQMNMEYLSYFYLGWSYSNLKPTQPQITNPNPMSINHDDVGLRRHQQSISAKSHYISNHTTDESIPIVRQTNDSLFSNHEFRAVLPPADE